MSNFVFFDGEFDRDAVRKEYILRFCDNCILWPNYTYLEPAKVKLICGDCKKSGIYGCTRSEKIVYKKGMPKMLGLLFEEKF